MKTAIVQVKIDKKIRELSVLGSVFYKQSQWVEAADERSNTYYLGFYKGQFINGAKQNKIRLNSFLHKALQHGVHFQQTHPVTRKLLLKSPYSFTTFNQLYQQLEANYPTLEATMILSFFDTFTKQGSIPKLIQKKFYDYKRNGQNQKAFIFIKVAVENGLESKFIEDMYHDLSMKAHRKELEDMTNIRNTSPLIYESVLWNIQQADSSLSEQYIQEDRLLEALAVSIQLLQNHWSNEYFQQVSILFTDYSTEEQTEMLNEFSHHPTVQDHLFTTHMESGDNQQLLSFLFQTGYTPNAAQAGEMLLLLEKADANTLQAFSHADSAFILNYTNGNNQKTEKLTTSIVAALLEIQSTEEVVIWLKDLKQTGIDLPIFHKLELMQEMEQDPDQQFALGEIYVEFALLEKSIDCFKWEMELNPTNKKPITYLTKVYDQLGNQEEAAAYQQLLKHM